MGSGFGPMASPSEVTNLYRARLSANNAQILAQTQALFVRLFDPRDPAGSLRPFGAYLGRLITQGQYANALEATTYLRALVAQATGLPLDAIDPFDIPPNLVGTVMNGSTTVGYCNQAPAVYFNRIGQGQSPEMAATSTLAWANMTAGSEPWRVANGTVNHNATSDRRYTGRCNRITRASACEFCTLIADRGYIPSHADFAAHHNCHCTAEPEISSYATSRASIRRGMAATEQQSRLERWQS